MPALRPSEDTSHTSDEVLIATSSGSLKALHMRVYRRTIDTITSEDGPHSQLIQVRVPHEYFNLHIQPPCSSTIFIEAVPTPLLPCEQEALNANPLLANLCLILSGQKNPSAHHLYIVKAVAIALRDEYYRFSVKHLDLQSRTTLVDGSEPNSSKPESSLTVKVKFKPPQKSQLVSHIVSAENTPVEPEESQVLIQHRKRGIQALVLAGQAYPDHPVGPLYKAVARVFKRAC